MIAAGLGCRKNCTAEDILVAIAGAAARSRVNISEISILCAADFKRGEASLGRAANRLNLPLLFLPRERLEECASAVMTQSAHVAAVYGLPSLAETAALAGVGEGARLLAPRFTHGGAACALAGPDGSP